MLRMYVMENPSRWEEYIHLIEVSIIIEDEPI
jgi:hypothetical protein